MQTYFKKKNPLGRQRQSDLYEFQDSWSKIFQNTKN